MVLVPSWAVAAVTEEMIYVMPMVVASALMAAVVSEGILSTRMDEGAEEADAPSGAEGR